MGTNRTAGIPRIVWLFVTTIFLVFLVQIVAQHLTDGLMIGINVENQQHGVAITAIRDDTPAAHVNMKQGTLLSINNVVINAIADIAAGIKTAKGGESTIVIQQQGEQYIYQVDTGRAVNYRPLVLNFLIIVVFISIALGAIRTAHVDRRAVILAWFSLVVALDATMSGGFGYWPNLAHYSGFFRQLLASLQFALMAHLISLIPRPAPWMKLRFMPATIYVAAIVIHLFFTLILYGMLTVNETWTEISRIFFANNLPYIGWGLATVLILVYQFTRTQERRPRQQVKWILASVLPWLLLQFSDVVFTGTGWVGSDWYMTADAVAHLAFPIGLLIAIFRYNLLDLSELFPRPLFYRVLTLMVMTVLAVVMIETGIVISSNYFAQSAIWSVGLGSLILGVSYAPVRRGIEGLIEGRSTYQQHHLGQQLRQLFEYISVLDKPAEIQEQLTRRLSSLLHSKMVVVHLHATDEGPASWPVEDGGMISLQELQLDQLGMPLQLSKQIQSDTIISRLYQHGLDLVIPLQHQQRHIGSILVGRNLTGQRYAWREIELLNFFAQNLSTKLTNIDLVTRVRFDNLTGLYRREVVLDLIQKTILDGGVRQACSIAMIDLDDFKQLNDQQGHLFGDQALKAAARAAQSCLGEDDRLARFGGEEFLLFMHRDDPRDAIAVAKKIRQAIADVRLFNVDGQQVRLSVSIGVASIMELQAGQDVSPTELMREFIDVADKYLYQAKAAGKNRVANLLYAS